MNLPAQALDESEAPRTILGQLDSDAFETKSSLTRAFTSVGDQISIMKDLFELNNFILGTYKGWAMMSEQHRPVPLKGPAVPRLLALNGVSQSAIASCGAAAFKLDKEFLDGERHKLSGNHDTATNHILNGQALSLAKHAISFDRQFASITFSLSERSMQRIESLSLSDTRELLQLNQVMPIHPLPAFKSRRSVRNRYQTVVLVGQTGPSANDRYSYG